MPTELSLGPFLGARLALMSGLFPTLLEVGEWGGGGVGGEKRTFQAW